MPPPSTLRRSSSPASTAGYRRWPHSLAPIADPRSSADAAARAFVDVWRAADLRARARGLPATVTEALERLLDRIVRSAIEDPAPVHRAAQVAAALEADAHPPPVGGAVLWAFAARSRRMLKVGRRTVPLALVAKLGTDVVGSFRLGAYELELLASLLVQRLRAVGRPVDPRLVQRVTVNAYLNPGRRHDVTRRRRGAAAQLPAMWAGRVLAVEPAVGRVRKAAELLESLDVVSLGPT